MTFFSRPRQRDNYIPLKGNMFSCQGVAISVRALGRGEFLRNKYQSRSDHMVTYSFPFLYVVNPPTEPPSGYSKTIVLLQKTLISFINKIINFFLLKNLV